MDIIIKALIEERKVQQQLLRYLDYIESTHKEVNDQFFWFRHHKLKEDVLLKKDSIQAEIDRIVEERNPKT